MKQILQPTDGQLERSLSQRIAALYRTQLGHQPSKVTCNFVDEKIAIFVEDSITQPEQLLVDSGEQKLAEKVRFNIDQAIRVQLKTLIEEVVDVPVIDLLIDSAIATGRTSTIAVLATTPKGRESSSIPQLKQQMGQNADGGES